MNGGIHRILLATDFSPPAQHAQDYACLLAERLSAELYVLHVIPDSFPRPRPEWSWIFPSDAVPLLVHNAEWELAVRMAAALPRSLTIVRAVIVGRDILDYAKTHAIDLIVIGTHGYTELSHLLLGIVAEPSGVSPLALTLLIRWWIKSISPSLVPRS